MAENSDAHDTTVAAEACVRDARRERMSRAIDAAVDTVIDEAALAGGALAICFWLRELADGISPPSDVAETSGLVDMFFRHNEALVGQLQKQTSSTKAVLLTHIDSLRADLVAAHPQCVARHELPAMTGYNEGSTLRNAVAKLRQLELIAGRSELTLTDAFASAAISPGRSS